jgi:hypothetical protein
MDTKELNGYKIIFYTDDEYDNLPMYQDRTWLDDKLFVGNVSGAYKELCELIIDSDFYETINGIQNTFYNYKTEYFDEITPTQSFQTLSDLLYCSITKL